MILHSKFSPSWWLSNPHLQTIWAARLRKHAELNLDTERLELPDGDFVDLMWSRQSSGAVVCLFHGLAGSVHSVYINQMIKRLEQNGYRPVLMHFRGCSGEPNRLSKTYHSGHTDDIRFFIQTVTQRVPKESIHAIGYSLGANALLKYLGEQGSRCPLNSAIAVSPPLVLQEGAKRMATGLSRVYQRYLLEMMCEQHNDKRRIYPQLHLPEAGHELNTFWEFDNKVTAPLNGFKDVHDYYQKCSSRQFLSKIEIPTHVIHSRDDPFFSAAVIPTEGELADSVTFELTRKGGHVAFIAGRIPLMPKYWLETRILNLLAQQSLIQT